MAATGDAADWRGPRGAAMQPPVLPVRAEPPVSAPAALDALYAWLTRW